MKLHAYIFFILLGYAGCESTKVLQGVNDILEASMSESPLTQEETGNGIKEALINGVTNGTEIGRAHV